jgi:hypothetical protein
VMQILISLQRTDIGETSPIEDVSCSDNGDVLGGSHYWPLTLMTPTQETCPLVHWSNRPWQDMGVIMLTINQSQLCPGNGNYRIKSLHKIVDH